MSGQQQQAPDPRALAPSGRPPWYRTGRYRRTLLIGGGLAALLVATMVLMPPGRRGRSPTVNSRSLRVPNTNRRGQSRLLCHNR